MYVDYVTVYTCVVCLKKVSDASQIRLNINSLGKLNSLLFFIVQCINKHRITVLTIIRYENNV